MNTFIKKVARPTLFILLALVLLPLSSRANEFELTDISGHPYEEGIKRLVDMQIIGGYPDGTFKPDKSVNRAEALKIILQSLRVLQAENGEDAFVMPENFDMFSDLKSDEWYATYVAEGVDRGIINGYPDGTFKGGNTVNLAEALKMTFEAHKIFLSNYDYDEWYGKYFNTLRALGLYSEELSEPDKLLTRAELAYIVERVISVDYASISIAPLDLFTFASPAVDYEGHLMMDVDPWIELGASPNDPTTKEERIQMLAETEQGRKALNDLGYEY